MLGGGMRQAGILAAAGIYALRNNIERLADDHSKARRLAEGLTTCLEGAGIASIDLDQTETNMAFLDVEPTHLDGLKKHLLGRGIIISTGNPVRLVTHLDIEASGIAQMLEAVTEFVNGVAS